MHIRKLMMAMAAMAFAVTAVAQSAVGTFSVVPRLGVAIANVSDTHVYEYGSLGTYQLEGKYQPGFTGGVEMMYQVLPQMAVSAGVMYAAEGCRYGDIEVGTGAARVGINQNSITSHWLQVPVMARYYVAKGFSVNAGVRLGFLLSANHAYDAVDITYNDVNGTREYGESRSYDDDMKEELKGTSVSIPIGLSYEYMNVMLDARYHIPLTKSFDSEADGKWQGFAVTVGYKFDL